MNRATLLAVGAILLATSLLGWALWGFYDQESRHLLRTHQAALERGYRDTVESFGKLVHVAHHKGVDTPEVHALLVRLDGLERLPAAQAEAEERRLRGLLYRALHDTYALLRDNDVRTLSVVLPDGSSFLRLHRPDLVADPIAEQRPLLREVITRQVPGQGFENGRVVPGYRFVFPMLATGRLLAVADYGLSDDALRRMLRRGEAGRSNASRFMLRRTFVESVAHPSMLRLFESADVAPGFVVERENSPLRNTQHKPPSLPLALVERSLATDRGFQRALAEGRAQGGYACVGVLDCVAWVLLPVMDSAGRNAGFFVSYHDEPEVAALRWRLLAAFGTGTGLLLLAGVTFRRWLTSRQRLKTIMEHMAEGLYVMDQRGRIIHVNDAACGMLGYARKDLLGQDAHALFHLHSDGEALPAELCPVRREPLLGRRYRNDDEVFRRRDGALVQVSVVASPLREEGLVVGSVVLFRDISAEREARERLNKADVAFRNLGEAVVLTDADGNIQAVNAAFEQITGYAEAEVIGENPRLLQSGRHDQAFYRNMWGDLSSRGRWEGEIWNRRKNGDAYPEWLRITAVPGRGGSVLGYVSVFSDISELRANQEELRQLAYNDQLTGLHNRAAFLGSLSRALAHASVSGGRLAVMYLDVDRFKRINDMLGHQAGDDLLREIGNRLRGVLGPADEAARLGGDEYVILLREAEQRTRPTRVAHALLAEIRRPLLIDGRTLHVTASIGIAMSPDDGLDAAALMKHADAAMYLAKQEGRDAYRYFTASMARDARRRFELEAALREALSRDELRLVYQPKVSLADGAVIGLEALLRWQQPDGSLRAPGDFLDVAKESGLMPPITEWVLHEAARQCRAWRAQGVAFGRVSVNLDAGSCQPTLLEGMLLQIVREAGIQPKDLELEILETAMHSDTETLALWQRLVDVGFELSIDDFGTGESSLGRMKHLPVATLKIDRSFVADIEQDEGDRAMIRTIVAMTKILGKRALAEGVETEAQLRFLLRSGCDVVQGYYFSKPKPPMEIPSLLRDGAFADALRPLRCCSPALQGVVHQFPG